MSAAFDMMIVGDDEPVPVIERSWYAVTRDEPDAARALSVFLRISSEIMERVYPLYAAMLAASATTQRQQSLLGMALGLSAPAGVDAANVARQVAAPRARLGFD